MVAQRRLFRSSPAANAASAASRATAWTWSRCRASTSPARAGGSSASSTGRTSCSSARSIPPTSSGTSRSTASRTRSSCRRCCSSSCRSRRRGHRLLEPRHHPLRRVADLGRRAREVDQVFGCGSCRPTGSPRPPAPSCSCHPKTTMSAARTRTGCAPPAGRCPGVELRIVDSEAQRLARGRVGEVWIRVAQQHEGLLEPARGDGRVDHARRLVPHRRRRLPRRDGYLYIHDRIKDMIIIGRREHLPRRDRERAHEPSRGGRRRGDRRARRHVGRDGQGDRRARARRRLTEHELMAYCRERLAHYKCPTSVDWTERCPATRRGRSSRPTCASRTGRARSAACTEAPAVCRQPAGVVPCARAVRVR